MVFVHCCLWAVTINPSAQQRICLLSLQRSQLALRTSHEDQIGVGSWQSTSYLICVHVASRLLVPAGSSALIIDLGFGASTRVSKAGRRSLVLMPPNVKLAVSGAMPPIQGTLAPSVLGASARCLVTLFKELVQTAPPVSFGF